MDSESLPPEADPAEGHEGRYPDSSESPRLPTHAPLDVESPAAMGPVFGGLWRRSFAFVLDALLLSALGYALGYLFFDPLASLGGWGRLLGFGITLAYFVPLNSSVGGGRTLGKRAMRIRVVDSSGRHVSISRSALRFSILAVPFFLSGVVDQSSRWPGLDSVLSLALFGFGGALLYLYVFNRRTRQSLHDLAADTFVVRSDSSALVESSIWRPHLAIALGVLVVIGAAGFDLTTFVTSRGDFPEMLAAQQAILSTGKVHEASIMAGKAWNGSGEGNGVSRFVSVQAVWKDEPDDYAAAASEVASIVMREFPAATEMDSIRVAIARGFDLGIARGSKGQMFQYSPESGGVSATWGTAQNGSRGDSSIDRQAALAFSDSFVAGMVGGDDARVYAGMEKEFRDAVSQAEFPASLAQSMPMAGDRWKPT